MQGHATKQHVRAGTIFLWHLRRTSWRTSRRRKALLFIQVSQCKGLFLGMVGEVPGSASRLRETRRTQRQRRTLPVKLVVFQREPRKKRATHAKFSRAHTSAKTGNLGCSAGGAGSTPHNK